jgi:hypothetical protein
MNQYQNSKEDLIMSYKDSKIMLNKIREDYACKGEVIFRSALQYVVECGCHLLTNPLWVNQQLNNIDVNHDEAEKEGKILLIARDFEKAIIECAAEIAKVPTMDMLQYVQKEVWLSGEGIDYQRAIELLKKCMEDIEDARWCNNKDVYDAFEYMGFTDDEIETLGFGHVFDYEEEE